MAQIQGGKLTTPRLADLPRFPYATLSELRQACADGRASLSVDRSFSMQWIDLPGVKPSRIETVLHFTWSWALSWVGLLMVAFAWGNVGPKAILLVLVSLIAGFYCRPWRGFLSWWIALAALVFANGFASWAGGTWLLTALLMCGWTEWCGNQFNARLLQNEALLVWALQPRGPDPLHEHAVAVVKVSSAPDQWVRWTPNG